MTELQKKRESRKKETAEVFTPPALVNEMLDKLPQEAWTDPEFTFLDPAAGDGNFLVEILRRKIEAGQTYLAALKTLWQLN